MMQVEGNEIVSYVDACDKNRNLTALRKCDHRTIHAGPFVECITDTRGQSQRTVEHKHIERSWAGWSDPTVGTTLSQNQRGGGPGGPTRVEGRDDGKATLLYTRCY